MQKTWGYNLSIWTDRSNICYVRMFVMLRNASNVRDTNSEKLVYERPAPV